MFVATLCWMYYLNHAKLTTFLDKFVLCTLIFQRYFYKINKRFEVNCLFREKTNGYLQNPKINYHIKLNK